MWQLTIFGIILCSIANLEAKESVPLLIWKDERLPLDIPAVSAVQIPFSHLEEKYLQSFNPDNILLFLQDTLSVEDLSSYGDVLKNVKKMMEKKHSLYLPAIEVKTSIAHTLSAHGYNIITLEPGGSSAGELKLKKDSKNLVLVKLPSTTTNPSRKVALQKSDEVIQNVLSKIDQKANFTVLFTGKEPSVKLESKVEHMRMTRSLKETEPLPESSKFFETLCALLYVKSDIIFIRGNVSYPLHNNASHKALHDCRNDSSIIIQYKELYENIPKVKLSLKFTKFRRSWTLGQVMLEVMDKSSSLEVYEFIPTRPMPHVPLQKSYSCARKLVMLSNTTDSSTNKPASKLIINGFQVQAFTKGKNHFSDSWDCVGFFTIPIWMGIFAGVVLTLILLIGMFMLSEIKTMDRFDDPKGKHLMVTGTAAE